MKNSIQTITLVFIHIKKKIYCLFYTCVIFIVKRKEIEKKNRIQLQTKNCVRLGSRYQLLFLWNKRKWVLIVWKKKKKWEIYWLIVFAVEFSKFFSKVFDFFLCYENIDISVARLRYITPIGLSFLLIWRESFGLAGSRNCPVWSCKYLYHR